MKPTRIGKPYTVTDHGKAVTRVYVWFPNGTRELMSLMRLEWTRLHGRPSKGCVVYPKNGDHNDFRPENLVCVPRAEMASEKNRFGGPTKSEGSRKGWAKRRDWRAKATRIYLEHKPYPLAA